MVIEGRRGPFLACAIIVCNEGTDSRPLPRRRNFATLVSSELYGSADDAA